MSIMTGRGDEGSTQLLYGRRVPKNHPRVEAYGTVDELSAALGLVRGSTSRDDLKDRIRRIQEDLLRVATELAVSEVDQDRYELDCNNGKFKPLTESALSDLEENAVDLEDRLPPMKEFVLPGHTLTSAHLHFARTLCRRAERRILDLKGQGGGIRLFLLKYMNRLSDYLWLLAREEETWESEN
jgi:cob(I)alamin adenosyltransferase